MIDSTEMRQLIYTIVKVLNFFNGDLNRTALWFTINNPNLGGIAPIMFFKMGRGFKVVQFVDSQIEVSVL